MRAARGYGVGRITTHAFIALQLRRAKDMVPTLHHEISHEAWEYRTPGEKAVLTADVHDPYGLGDVEAAEDAPHALCGQPGCGGRRRLFAVGSADHARILVYIGTIGKRRLAMLASAARCDDGRPGWLEAVRKLLTAA